MCIFLNFFLFSFYSLFGGFACLFSKEKKGMEGSGQEGFRRYWGRGDSGQII